VANGQKRYVQCHVLQPVKKKDRASEAGQVVVASDHVLGAEIRVRDDVHAPNSLEELCVTLRDAMSRGGER
jgi:hypothetical protein